MSTLLFFYLIGVCLAAITCMVYIFEYGSLRLSDLLTSFIITVTSFVGIGFAMCYIFISVITSYCNDPLLWRRRR